MININLKSLQFSVFNTDYMRGIKLYQEEIDTMAKRSMLEDFKIQVIQVGPYSTLPKNLSEQWLRNLANALERIIESDESNYPKEADINEDMEIIVLAINHIFRAKARDKGQSIADKLTDESPELTKYLEGYRMELALESISRVTDISVNPANIETIFTNREVMIEQKH